MRRDGYTLKWMNGNSSPGRHVRDTGRFGPHLDPAKDQAKEINDSKGAAFQTMTVLEFSATQAGEADPGRASSMPRQHTAMGLLVDPESAGGATTTMPLH